MDSKQENQECHSDKGARRAMGRGAPETFKSSFTFTEIKGRHT